MDQESRLEDLLAQDISIASPNWLVFGRQVPTAYGKYIDLLAMDRDGRLIVLELKRNRTPREVVAQLLDYGSWVKDLSDTDIANIYE
jgi:RecB family endonuclease NucS